MQRKFNQAVFVDKQGKKSQLERGIREASTRWLIGSRRQKRGLPISTCVNLLEAQLFESECFSPAFESRTTSLTIVPRSRAVICSGSAITLGKPNTILGHRSRAMIQSDSTK